MDSNIFVGICLIASALLFTFVLRGTGHGRIVSLKGMMDEYSNVVKTTMEMYKRYIKMLAQINYRDEEKDDIVDQLLKIKKESLISALTMTEMTFIFQKGSPQFSLISKMVEMFNELQLSCDYSLKYMVSDYDFYSLKAISHMETSGNLFKESLEESKTLDLGEGFNGMKF